MGWEEMMQEWKQNQNRNEVEIDYARMKKENKIEMRLRRDDNNVIKESVKWKWGLRRDDINVNKENEK